MVKCGVLMVAFWATKKCHFLEIYFLGFPDLGLMAFRTQMRGFFPFDFAQGQNDDLLNG